MRTVHIQSRESLGEQPVKVPLSGFDTLGITCNVFLIVITNSYSTASKNTDLFVLRLDAMNLR